MITKEKVEALDAYDLAKEMESSDPNFWQQNIQLIQDLNPKKAERVIGFLSLEGGPRELRIYALETSRIPKHFVRNAAQDRDSEIRKRARGLLDGKRKSFFWIAVR